jgi:hypothetical protein
MSFEVFLIVNIHIAVFWVTAPCSWVPPTRKHSIITQEAKIYKSSQLVGQEGVRRERVCMCGGEDQTVSECPLESLVADVEVRPLLSSNKRLHIIKRTCLEENKNFGHGSQRDSKPRITLLTRASRNLTDRPSWVSCAHDSCCHELVERQSPASMNVSTVAREYLLLRAVTR